MNLAEFNALKAGDRIENAMSGSTGEVVEADSKGVAVRWSGFGPERELATAHGTKPAGATRHYSRFSTIWFHWSKVEADDGYLPDDGRHREPEERIMACPQCGADDPPNHKPGCTSPLAQAQHKSDCAVNNGPALPAGPCDCGATEQ